MNKAKLLNKLKIEVEKCQRCPLYKTRTKVVFETGPANAKLMIVSEAPGYWEDQKGEPFVGAAGKVLDELLESKGISKIHGKVFEVKNLFQSVKIIPLYHPAVGTYNANMIGVLKKDFRVLTIQKFVRS